MYKDTFSSCKGSLIIVNKYCKWLNCSNVPLLSWREDAHTQLVHEKDQTSDNVQFKIKKKKRKRKSSAVVHRCRNSPFNTVKMTDFYK